MISDLSFLCSTVTFADPPTLQDHRRRTREGAKGVCVFKKKKEKKGGGSDVECVFS